MQVTFLGTGTSSGVPVLTCHCEVCRSIDYRDKRLRVSVWIETEGKSFIIDTGPDFRQQALSQRIGKVDAVIFTHEHKDHTAGLDDIRPYNYLSGKKHLPVYAHQRVLHQLKQEYYYAFQENAYPGVPLLETIAVDKAPFTVAGIEVIPIEVMHLNLPVLAYRIGNFTYITDANYISDESLEKIKGSETVVLNALQRTPHISHFNLEEALKVAGKIGAKRTFLTHISHKLGLHREVETELPENVFLAYDGLRIQV